ncbi:phage tail protein [Silvibacterium sp.]|uniref:phage tail protein n=1 Tax=Silvibacterium sp. TaxID=1964179 RepID=UPI0039E3A8A7
METYLGLILLWPMNFAPYGWAFCQGQTLSIAQNAALFSLLGTTYGGDGVSNFQLPNLQSRVPVGVGQGIGLSNYVIGQQDGDESITLNVTTLPAHTHTLTAGQGAVTLQAGNGTGSTNDPTNNYIVNASDGAGTDYLNYAPAASAGTLAALATGQVNLSGVQLSSTGGSLPHSNIQPYLALNYIIALQGIFPTRG